VDALFKIQRCAWCGSPQGGQGNGHEGALDDEVDERRIYFGHCQLLMMHLSCGSTFVPQLNEFLQLCDDEKPDSLALDCSERVYYRLCGEFWQNFGAYLPTPIFFKMHTSRKVM
jgi:hypothetical protein